MIEQLLEISARLTDLTRGAPPSTLVTRRAVLALASGDELAAVAAIDRHGPDHLTAEAFVALAVRAIALRSPEAAGYVGLAYHALAYHELPDKPPPGYDDAARRSASERVPGWEALEGACEAEARLVCLSYGREAVGHRDVALELLRDECRVHPWVAIGRCKAQGVRGRLAAMEGYGHGRSAALLDLARKYMASIAERSARADASAQR